MKEYKNINRYLIDEAVKIFAGSVVTGELVGDIGAGKGHYRHFFRKASYVAIDLGLEQNSFNGLDVAGDICHLPFKDNVFDKLLCIEVLEHVWERELLLQELNRVLKPEGKLFITTPLCYGEHMQPYDYQRYTRFALEKLLRAHGFGNCTIETRGGYFTLIAHLVARIPDELMKSKRIPRVIARLFKPALRVLLTYLLAPLIARIDFAHGNPAFTLGYTCCADKVSLLSE